MLIVELCDTDWVISNTNAFKEESLGDGIQLFYVFLWERVGYANEATIAAEQYSLPKRN